MYCILSDQQFPSNLDFRVKVMVEEKSIIAETKLKKLNIGGEMEVLRYGRK